MRASSRPRVVVALAAAAVVDVGEGNPRTPRSDRSSRRPPVRSSKADSNRAANPVPASGKTRTSPSGRATRGVAATASSVNSPPPAPPTSTSDRSDADRFGALAAMRKGWSARK